MIRIFLFLIALFASIPAQAQLPGAPLKVTANLEAETTAPAAGGKVTLAFIMRPEPKWHGYWKNGGDAGVGMNLEWELPAGVTAGELRYPVPTTLIMSGLMNYVYEKPYTLLVDLTIGAEFKPGTKLPIKVNGLWLACDDRVCVPQEDNLMVDLTVGDGNVSAERRARFDSYRAALPVPIDQAAKYNIDGESIEIAVPFPENAKIERPYFFPQTERLFAYAAPQEARRIGDMLVLKTGADKFVLPDFKGGPVTGVLRIGEGEGLAITASKGGIPAGGEAVAVLGDDAAKNGIEGGSFTGFLGILFFSVLGGLLLNLMPCVFPILGLKALSLAKMGGDEAAARRDALSYSAGVILSVLALGAVMLALRAGGEQVGWAFQLQEPRIVLALLLLVAAITANLAGLFEINVAVTEGSGGGRFGSFGTGVLAAIVATPCTGPFMAAALGAALLLPTAQALLLFAGLGFGLALPYLAITYIPALRNRMPKAGTWLNTFRKVMAIPMALTALALLWLLWRLSDQYGLMIGLGALILLGGALLFAGKMQLGGKSAKMAMAAALGVTIAGIILLPREPAAAQKPGSDILKAETYSDEKLAEYRAEGRKVFVYFTADWCVTCKINEAAALNREETAAAFKDKDITVLVGDWTRRDPKLARVLARYERSGVPLYLYFTPDAQPQILPQILTPSILADLK